MLDVADPRSWRSWLKDNHLRSRGVWLIFHRKGLAEPSLSYEEAIDEALAYGWVDSIIKRIDDQSYARKFTPRRPGSIWSELNIGRVERLVREGRMTKTGLDAYEQRTAEKSLLEKFNLEGVRVPKDFTEALRKNKRAWSNFEHLAPSYRKRYMIWISGARKVETRRQRIDEAVILISRDVKALLK